jgi:HEAT repeat protein
MTNMISRSSTIAALVAFAGVLVSSSGNAEPAANYSPNVHGGRAAVYQQLLPNSLESVTPAERIREVATHNTAPTELWQVLEHGEKVECLGCIPSVSALLYNSNAKTREIAAWWLRRRIFGVFGPGQVYSQVLNTLKTDSSEVRRAYSAEALGEFLLWNGVPAVANAVVADQSPMVRLSAVRALERMNSEGPGAEVATAMSDQSADVKLAALHAATRINVFSRPDAIAPLLSDGAADVRRRAAEVLGMMRSQDAVVGLMALTDPTQESDPSVRTSAVGALGKIGDATAHDAVEAALADSDPLVRSVAEIALRRLY